MMNLLGCSKENFFEIMYLMNYRKEKNKSDLFSYKGYKKSKDKVNFINKKDNPFKKLMSLNLK